MNFLLTIKWSDIETARKQIISKHAQKIHLKGFRKGKAPLKLVEESINQKALTEEILDHVLRPAYAKSITDQKLKPISMPKITPKDVKLDSDWQFDIEIAEKPEVKLNDYKKYIKKSLEQAKKADSKPEDKKNPDHDPELVAIFDALLENATCDVPNLLIEEETNNQLSKLLSQIQKLGLTLEKYVATLKITVEDLKKQYQKTATDNLKLEFVLQALVDELKVTVDDAEIDDLINAVGDEHTREHLSTPQEKAGIRYMLSKRKVVELLKKI